MQKISTHPILEVPLREKKQPLPSTVKRLKGGKKGLPLRQRYIRPDFRYTVIVYRIEIVRWSVVLVNAELAKC